MSNPETKISVGIPIYGVERFIERCARSLFEQDLREGIEFIFVNDCTKDCSIEILEKVLEEYPYRKPQTRIIHAPKNGGSAATRNIALAHAKSKYMIFCDSDDWIEPNMYSTLLSTAESSESDMTICGFCWEYTNKAVEAKIPLMKSADDYVEQMLKGNIHCSTWNKLIKRDIYDKTQLRFPDGINMWEDVNVIIPLTFNCKKIAVVDSPLYHYEQSNATSYTKKLTPESLNNLIQTIRRLEGFVNSTKSSELSKALNYTKLTARLNLLLGTSGNEQKQFLNLFPEASGYIWSYGALSTYWKMGLWLASKQQIGIFRFMAWIKKHIA